MTRIEVVIRVEVHPTESREKVESAVKNVLGEVPLSASEKGGTTVLESRLQGVESLSHLRDLLRRTRIRDAARGLLTRISKEDVISFGLNKEAAYMGRASFHSVGESPLGPIQLTIRGDTEAAIGFLCDSSPNR
jgi:predicted RNA binding protein with dsRBD fold (UPF0201 family)